MFKISRTYRVIILVLLLHVALLAFLFLEWHLQLQRQQQDEQDLTLPETEAPVMFFDEPPSPQPSPPQQQAPPPVHEEQDLHEVIEEQHEEVPPQPAIIPQFQHRQNRKQAWFKKQPEQQPQKDMVRTMSAPPRDYFKFEHADDTSSRTPSSSLHERVTKQFADNAFNRYFGKVAQALCYELNKENIMAPTSDFPPELIFRVIIERSGTIREIQLVTQSRNQALNKMLKHALISASPLAPVPPSVKEDPVMLTFTIGTDRLQRTTDTSAPIRFYIRDPQK